MPSQAHVEKQAIEIPLTREYSATIDANDLSIVSKHKWSAMVTRNGCVYAATHIDGRTVLMHSLLKPSKGVVDHIDGDGLNNRQSNIRIATYSENNCNRKVPSNNRSGFKGVFWHKQTRKWAVDIRKGSVRFSLYGFHSAEDAARAYDKKARELHGEFARVNFPVGNERSARAAS